MMILLINGTEAAACHVDSQPDYLAVVR